MTDAKEVVERLAKAVYARNGWWRIVSENDDGNGRYRNTGEHRMRAVEWSDLDADERGQMLLDATAAMQELSAMGLVVVPSKELATVLAFVPRSEAADRAADELANAMTKVQP
jgi:hypothetical protein